MLCLMLSFGGTMGSELEALDAKELGLTNIATILKCKGWKC